MAQSKTNNKNLLIIFTRNPELGTVKKRLAAEIGEQSALEIYKTLLSHTAAVTKYLPCTKIVYYSESIIQEDLWSNTVYQKKVQKGQDLGERMEHAFAEGFHAGYSNIVIIGSDLLDLREQDLREAFKKLERFDFVLGPAQDGGYYLLGMKALQPSLFKNKLWGTDTVLQETLKDLKNEPISLLEERNDIDTIQDLEAHPELQQYRRQ